MIDNGISVSGGFVYRGGQIPDLNGLYVFGVADADYLATLPELVARSVTSCRAPRTSTLPPAPRISIMDRWIFL